MPNQRRRKTKVRARGGFKLRIPKFQLGVNADVAYMKSIINSELKEKVKAFAALTCTAAGTITHLTAISQGTTTNTRTGATVLPKYLNAKLCMLKDPSNADIVDIVRIIIFMWKENTTPLVADILETANVWGHYNSEHKGGNPGDRQITVLSDSSYTLIKGQRPCVNIKLDLQMNRIGQRLPIHIKYDGTSSTAPRNGIYLMNMAQEASAAFTDLSGEVLFKFHDN